jgi:hypothetical protein
MSINIDRSKCGAEYSLCPRCKYETDSYDKCQFCTQVVDVGYAYILCGVPVGSGITHLHKNFSPKEKEGAE